MNLPPLYLSLLCIPCFYVATIPAMTPARGGENKETRYQSNRLSLLNTNPSSKFSNSKSIQFNLQIKVWTLNLQSEIKWLWRRISYNWHGVIDQQGMGNITVARNMRKKMNGTNLIGASMAPPPPTTHKYASNLILFFSLSFVYALFFFCWINCVVVVDLLWA